MRDIKDNRPILLTGFGEINFGKQYRQGNRVYDSRAIAMALNAEKDYSRNFHQGYRVYGSMGIANTISSSSIGGYGDRDKDCGYSVHDYSNCIPSNPMSDRGQLYMDKRYRIRKLTPRECYKLMGLSFSDCDKASAIGVSNSQLYKTAGNGIVTNCVELLFEHLFKSQYDPNFTTYDENFTQATMV